MKLKIMGAALAAVCVASSAAMAMWPDSVRMYEYIYYSDSSRTTEVGFSFDQCINGYVVPGQAQGTATQYFTRIPIGNCPGYLY